MALTLDLLPGEKIEIGGCVTVRVLRKAGRAARLEVSAPASMTIVRDPHAPARDHQEISLPVSFRLCANSQRKAGDQHPA